MEAGLPAAGSNFKFNFSTITSAGGGGGGTYQPTTSNGQNCRWIRRWWSNRLKDSSWSRSQEELVILLLYLLLKVIPETEQLLPSPGVSAGGGGGAGAVGATARSNIR